jgi:hypothetical protein
MRAVIPPVLVALSLAIAAPLATVASTDAALAQAQPPAEQGEMKQIALTQKQIDSYLAAKKDMDAIIDKLPQDAQQQQPDAKTTAQLDAVAKKYKFSAYEEYDTVGGNIEMVLQGYDQQTKKYVGAETVIKQQIAAVKAEKGMSPKDKKEALEQLNEALKTAAAPLQFPANVDLVTKNIDKIEAAMPQQDQGQQKQ